MFNTLSLLGLSRPTWKVFTDITKYLTHMKKLKLMNHMGTGGLLVQSECKTELTYQVVECIQFMTRRDTQLIMPPTQYV